MWSSPVDDCQVSVCSGSASALTEGSGTKWRGQWAGQAPSRRSWVLVWLMCSVWWRIAELEIFFY